MGSIEVTPHHIHSISFWQSTNGKKVVMAVTGAIMFCFIVGHMIGNLQMFLAPEHINAYGHFLHHDITEELWIIRSILLLTIALHITATVQLALRSNAARPVGYSRKQYINSSYASRTMYWSGPIVLAFLIFHLLQFTAGYIHPQAQFVAGDVYGNVVSGFRVWWVSAWYIFALCLLGLHLSHGLWSAFQSLGCAHPRLTVYLKSAARAIAVLIVLGYISIPISVLLGVIK
ncbi:MAG: succinate dehydrogenase cytochrome b subunit [Acidobacteriaceae bacterium]